MGENINICLSVCLSACLAFCFSACLSVWHSVRWRVHAFLKGFVLRGFERGGGGGCLVGGRGLGGGLGVGEGGYRRLQNCNLL